MGAEFVRGRVCQGPSLFVRGRDVPESSPVPVLNYPDLDLQSMRGSRKFCQRGPTLTTFFFFFFFFFF